MKVYAVIDLVIGDTEPGVKLFLDKDAAEREEQRLCMQDQNPAYCVYIVECEFTNPDEIPIVPPSPRRKVHHLGAALQGIADYHADVLTPTEKEALYRVSRRVWDRDPAERIQELLEANSALVLKNQELGLQLKEAMAERGKFRHMSHDPRHVDVSRAERGAANIIAAYKAFKAPSVKAEDMFLYLRDTGELYETHKRMAAEKYTQSGWYQHIRRQGRPRYTKDHGPAHVFSFTQMYAAAKLLKDYYEQHIKEL